MGSTSFAGLFGVSTVLDSVAGASAEAGAALRATSIGGAAKAGAQAAGAGVPCSVTVTSALAGARADLPRRSRTLVPIITRKTAAIAVWGLMAQLPANEMICAKR